MAKNLSALKLRTQTVIRKIIQNNYYLAWANECLESVSEIAKREVEPLEFDLTGDEYQYVILNTGLHLHRFPDQIFDTDTTIYYDSVYNEIQKDWEDINEISEQNITVGDIDYVYITLDVETSSNEFIALKRVIEQGNIDYRYQNIDGTPYEELVLQENISQTLNIYSDGIDLPTDFQQMIKVTGLSSNNRLLKFDERGFGDREITSGQVYPHVMSPSNQTNLFFVSLEESKITFKSGLLRSSSRMRMTISYYAHLPLYDVEVDKDNFDNLSIPLEQTYHNLINYYCIYKYYESWQNSETSNDYFSKYLKLREEYAESVDRKHQENLGTVAEKVVSWR